MGNTGQTMPKVEFQNDEKLKTAFMYKKFIESKNFERAVLAKKSLTRKRSIFITSILTVLGIYSYTIFKIQQETFLDDFEEPPRIIKAEQ